MIGMSYSSVRFRSVELFASINRRYFTDKLLINNDISGRQILNIIIHTLCGVVRDKPLCMLLKHSCYKSIFPERQCIRGREMRHPKFDMKDVNESPKMKWFTITGRFAIFQST